MGKSSNETLLTVVLHIVILKAIHLIKLKVPVLLILQFLFCDRSFALNIMWRFVFQMKSTMVKINIRIKGRKLKSLRTGMYFCSSESFWFLWEVNVDAKQKILRWFLFLLSIIQWGGDPKYTEFEIYVIKRNTGTRWALQYLK